MGLDLFLKKSDYSSYSRSYGAYHSAKAYILDYYQARIDIDFYFANKTKEYPEISFEELDKLYPVGDDNEQLKQYKDILLHLEEKGILGLAPLLLHSDCDGKLPYKLCIPMIPLLEEVIKETAIMINGVYQIPGDDEDDSYYGLDVVLSLFDMVQKAVELKDDIMFA
jgi:hypothetical protein